MPSVFLPRGIASRCSASTAIRGRSCLPVERKNPRTNLSCGGFCRFLAVQLLKSELKHSEEYSLRNLFEIEGIEDVVFEGGSNRLPVISRECVFERNERDEIERHLNLVIVLTIRWEGDIEVIPKEFDVGDPEWEFWGSDEETDLSQFSCRDRGVESTLCERNFSGESASAFNKEELEFMSSYWKI